MKRKQLKIISKKDLYEIKADAMFEESNENIKRGLLFKSLTKKKD